MFDPAQDQNAQVNPGYTGAGEVVSVAELTRLFLRLGMDIRPKRSQLFTWDDARARSLIFVGAAPHNISLSEIPIGRWFRFKPYGQEPFRDKGCVQNLQPRAGEEAFFCTSTEGQTVAEYAIVTLARGPDQTHPVLFIAGTTTFGTQAATEFLCDRARAAELLSELGASGDAPVFEALLRCRLRGSAPISAELLAVRK
jgi:hypothetical protein